MFYTRITSVKAMCFILCSDVIICIESDNSNMFVYNDNDFKLLKIIPGNFEGGLYFVNNYVLDMHFQGVNIQTWENVCVFDSREYYFYSVNMNYYIVRKLLNDFKAELLLINKENLVVKQKLDISGRVVFFNNENDLVSILKTHVYYYRNFLMIWQHDLSTLSAFTNYEGKATKGEIRNIYQYNDSVIVITQLFIFRIDIASGGMIYSQKLPAGLLTLSLFQNRAFGCYGHHYLEIDLDSGEVINFKRIEHEEYEGEKYLAYMNEAYYDEGLVYHGIRLSNGVHGVGIIGAKTGNRLFFHSTGVHNVEQIKVHREKLFVRDTENLHVFDRITNR